METQVINTNRQSTTRQDQKGTVPSFATPTWSHDSHMSVTTQFSILSEWPDCKGDHTSGVLIRILTSCMLIACDCHVITVM